MPLIYAYREVGHSCRTRPLCLFTFCQRSYSWRYTRIYRS